MGISWNKKIEFEFTKTFKEEVNKFVQNKKSLKDRVNVAIIDFCKNNFDSVYYWKPLNNWDYRWLKLHELELWWDYRIIVQIIEESDIYKCYFINFWSHSSLNLKSNKQLKINPVYKK